MLEKKQQNTGLSEPLGYILLFSISIIVVGLLLGLGVPNLDEDMNNKKLTEIEDTFGILHSNISDIVWLNNTVRSTQVKTTNSRVQLSESNQIKIRFPSTGRQIYTNYQPIVYENTEVNGSVLYENGAVISNSSSGSLMIEEPRINSVNNTLVLPFISTKTVGNTSINSEVYGIETVQGNVDIKDITVGGNNPEFVVESEYPSAWLNHLQTNPNMTNCSKVSDSTVICEIDSSIDTIKIRSVQVNVSF